MKHFYFVLFIHYYKTVIKADQKLSFIPLSEIYCTKNIHDKVAFSEATKTNKQKTCISHFKVHPVSSSAPHISGLHTFGRKQVVNNDFFASQPCTTECTARSGQRLYSELSQTCICLAVIFMHLFNFLDGLF